MSTWQQQQLLETPTIRTETTIARHLPTVDRRIFFVVVYSLATVNSRPLAIIMISRQGFAISGDSKIFQPPSDTNEVVCVCLNKNRRT
jgi:hypothetical protein